MRSSLLQFVFIFLLFQCIQGTFRHFNTSDTQKIPNILRRIIVTPFLEVIFTETPMDYHEYGLANRTRGVVLNLIQITLTMITNMLE